MGRARTTRTQTNKQTKMENVLSKEEYPDHGARFALEYFINNLEERELLKYFVQVAKRGDALRELKGEPPQNEQYYYLGN